MDIDKNDLLKLNKNDFINNLGTDQLSEIPLEELDGFIKEFGFNSKEIRYIKLKENNNDILYRMLLRQFGENYKMPILTAYDSNNDYVLGFVGVKDKSSNKKNSDRIASFVLQVNKNYSEEIQDNLKLIEKYNLIQRTNSNEIFEDIENLRPIKDEFFKLLENGKLANEQLTTNELEILLEDIKVSQFDFNHLDIEQKKTLNLAFETYKKINANKMKLTKEQLRQEKIALKNVEAELLTPFNLTPNISADFYKENGSLYVQNYIKDIAEGSRREKITSNAAFDFKRQINTFFKKTNKMLDELINSNKDKIISSKLGRSIYGFTNRSASKNNTPILQNIHRSIINSNIVTKYQVNGDKDIFGSAMKVTKILNDKAFERSINDITETYSSNQYKKFYEEFLKFTTPYRAKNSKKVFDMFIKNNPSISKNFTELIKNNDGDLYTNFLLKNKVALVETLKEFMLEEVKKDINPLRGEYFFETAINEGLKRDELINNLYKLKNKSSDYFKILDRLIQNVSENDKKIISPAELKNIFENSKLGIIDLEFKTGITKELLDTNIKVFEKNINLHETLIDEISSIVNNSKDSQEQAIQSLKSILNKIFKESTPIIIAKDFFDAKRNSTKISANAIELINRTIEKSKSNYSKMDMLKETQKAFNMKIKKLNEIERNKIYFSQDMTTFMFIDSNFKNNKMMINRIKDRGIGDIRIFTSDEQNTKNFYNSETISTTNVNTYKYNKKLFNKTFSDENDEVNILVSKKNLQKMEMINNSDFVVIFNKDNDTLLAAKNLKKDLLIIENDKETFIKNSYNKANDFNLSDYKNIAIISENNYFSQDNQNKLINLFKNKKEKMNIQSSSVFNSKNRIELSFDTAAKKGLLNIKELDIKGKFFKDENGIGLFGDNGVLKKLSNKDMPYPKKINIIKDIVKYSIQKISKNPETLEDVLTFLQGKTLTFEDNIKTYKFNIPKILAESLNEMSENLNIKLSNKKLANIVSVHDLNSYSIEEKNGILNKNTFKNSNYGDIKNDFNISHFKLKNPISIGLDGKKYAEGSNIKYKDILSGNISSVEIEKIIIPNLKESVQSLENFTTYKNIEEELENLTKLNRFSKSYKEEINKISRKIEDSEIKKYFNNNYISFNPDNIKNNKDIIFKEIMEEKARNLEFNVEEYLPKDFINKLNEKQISLEDVSTINNLSNAKYNAIRNYIEKKSDIDISEIRTFNFNNAKQLDVVKSIKNKTPLQIIKLVNEAIENEKQLVINRKELMNLDYNSLTNLYDVFKTKGFDIAINSRINNNISGIKAYNNATVFAKTLTESLLDITDDTVKEGAIKKYKNEENLFKLNSFGSLRGIRGAIEKIKNTVEGDLTLDNEQKKSKIEKITSELLSVRFFDNPNLSKTLTIENMTGNLDREVAIINIPIVLDNGVNKAYIQTQLRFNNTSASNIIKGLTEEEKSATYQITKKDLDEVFELGKTKLMLSTFVDKLKMFRNSSKNLLSDLESYIIKNNETIEKALKNNEIDKGTKQILEDYKISRGLISGLYSGNKNIDPNKYEMFNRINAFSKIMEKNINKIKNGVLKNRLVDLPVEIKIGKDKKINYGYNLKEFNNILDENIKINLTGNNKTDIKTLANKILNSKLDKHEKIDLMYLLPTDRDMDRELFKAVNYFLTNPNHSYGINQITHLNNLNLIYNLSENTSLPQTKINEKLFLKTQNGVFADKMNEFLFNKLMTGDFDYFTSLTAKQQNAIAGKTYNIPLDFLQEGHMFNEESQRFYQTIDARSDMVFLNSNIKNTLNSRIAEISTNNSVEKTPLRSTLKKTYSEAVNNITSEYGYKNKYSTGTFYHKVLVGDFNSLVLESGSISSHKAAFQEGSQFALSGASTGIFSTNIQYSFNIANLNKENVEKVFNRKFKNEVEMKEFFVNNKNKMNLFLDKKISSGISNEKLLNDMINKISKKENIYEKLSTLITGIKIAELSKEGKLKNNIGETINPEKINLSFFKHDKKIFNELNKISDSKEYKKLSIDRATTLYESTLSHIVEHFFGGSMDNLGYTQILNGDLFIKGEKDHSLRRKAGTSFLINDIEFLGNNIIVKGIDISTTRPGDKIMAEGQKETVSAINDYIKVKYNNVFGELKTIDVASIQNTKAEKRAQIGTKLLSILKTSYINIYESDTSKNKTIFKKFVKETSDMLSEVGGSIKNINNQGFDFDNLISRIIPEVELTGENLAKIFKEDKSIQSVYMDKQVELVNNLIKKYGNHLFDVDKSDTAYMAIYNKTYENFIKKHKLNADKILIRVNQVQTGHSNIQLISRENVNKGISNIFNYINGKQIKTKEINYSLNDAFFLVKANITKSSANENKKKENGLKINYYMEEAMALTGYKDFTKTIKEQATSKAKKIFLKSIDNIHNEYTTSNILKTEKTLLLEKNQDILFNSFKKSLDDIYSEKVNLENSYLNSSSKNINGIKTVGVLDLNKVNSDDYIALEKGSRGNYLSELISNSEIEINSDNNKIFTVTKNSFEHKLALEISKGKKLSDINNLISEAKIKNINVIDLYDKIKDSNKIKVFNSEVGKVLVENNIVMRGDKNISGILLVKDNKNMKTYEEIASSIKFLSKLSKLKDDEKDINRVLEVFNKAQTLDSETFLEKNKIKIINSKSYLFGIIKNLSEMIEVEHKPQELKNLIQTKKSFSTLYSTLQFLKEGEIEEINNFKTFMKNKGVGMKMVNLNFILNSSDNNGIVISDSYRDLQTLIRDNIKYNSNEKEMNYIYKKINSNHFDDLLSLIQNNIKKIKNIDTDILKQDFTLDFSEVRSLIDYNHDLINLIDNSSIKTNVKNTIEQFNNIGEKVFNLQKEMALFESGTMRNFVNMTDEPIELMDDIRKNIITSIELINEDAKKLHTQIIDNSQSHEYIEAFKGIHNSELLLNKYISKLDVYNSRQINSLFKTFKGNNTTDSFSKKTGELFKNMRYTVGNSRVAMPIEGSLIETKIIESLYDKKNGIKKDFLNSVREVFGDNFVDEVLMEPETKLINEQEVITEYITKKIKKKDKEFFKQFGFNNLNEVKQEIKNIDKIFKNNIVNIGETYDIEAFNKIQRIGEYIALENRFSLITDLVITDYNTIKDQVDKSFMGRKIIKRDYAFLSRHPQQSQFHISGVNRIVIDFSKLTQAKNTNPVLLLLNEAMSKEKNDAPVVFLGKITAKMKRGDHDGDKIVLSEINSVTDKNVASLQFGFFNKLKKDLSNFEVVNNKGEVHLIKTYLGKSIKELDKEFSETVFNRLKTSKMNKLSKGNIKTFVEALTGLNEQEINIMRTTNNIYKFYFKGRVIDELPKHQNAYITFLEHLANNENLSNKIEEFRIQFNNDSNKWTDKELEDFNNKISEYYLKITGEDTNDFSKLLSKPEISKFFTSEKNISIFSKAVNIKNTGIIFEETAKYRIPGAKALDFDIENFINHNKFFSYTSDEEIKQLKESFMNFKVKQLTFSKLADIYYDNANESAISAKHGLSLDALINAREYIKRTHNDKKLSNLSLALAEKYTGLKSLDKNELITTLNLYREAYSSAGQYYQILEEGEKEIIKKVGKNFYSNNVRGIRLIDQEILNHLNPQNDADEDLLNKFASEFILKDKINEFKSIIKKDNPANINLFNEFFKLETTHITTEFSGREVSSSINIISGSMENLSKKINTVHDEKLKEISKLIISLNKDMISKTANEKISKFDLTKTYIQPFKEIISKSIDSHNLTDETISSYFKAMAVFTNVLSQNEKNAEIGINEIDELITALKNNNDKNFKKILTNSIDGNITGKFSSIFYNLKVISSLMGDSSNIKNFRKVYEYKLKNDYFEDITNELKNNSDYQNNKKDFDELIIRSLNNKEKLNIENILSSQSVEANEENLKSFNTINTHIEKYIKISDIKEKEFIENPSKATAQLIDFQSSSSSNKGASNPQKFLHNIIEMIRTGKNISILDSSLHNATRETKATVLTLSTNTLKKIMEDEGEKIIENHENNLKSLTGNNLFKGEKIKKIIGKIISENEIKDSHLDILSNELKRIKDNEMLLHLKETLPELKNTYNEKMVSVLKEFYKEFSYYSLLKQNLDANSISIDDFIENMESQIYKKKKDTEKLLTSYGVLSEGKININIFNKFNNSKLDNYIEETENFLKTFKISNVESDISLPEKIINKTLIKKLEKNLETNSYLLPNEPLELLNFLGKNKINNLHAYFEKLNDVTLEKQYSKELKFKFNMLSSIISNTNDIIDDSEKFHKYLRLKHKLSNEDDIIKILSDNFDKVIEDLKNTKLYKNEYERLTSSTLINKGYIYKKSKLAFPILDLIANLFDKTSYSSINIERNQVKTNATINKAVDSFLNKNQKNLEKNGLGVDEELFRILSKKEALKKLEKKMQSTNNLEKELTNIRKNFDKTTGIETVKKLHNYSQDNYVSEYFKKESLNKNLKKIGIGVGIGITALTTISLARRLFTITETTKELDDEEKAKIRDEIENNSNSDTIKNNNINLILDW